MLERVKARNFRFRVQRQWKTNLVWDRLYPTGVVPRRAFGAGRPDRICFGDDDLLHARPDSFTASPGSLPDRCSRWVGGNSDGAGGRGATIEGSFTFTTSEVLSVIVGGQGE